MTEDDSHHADGVGASYDPPTAGPPGDDLEREATTTTPGATTDGATTPGATTAGATTAAATTPGATTPGATTPAATTAVAQRAPDGMTRFLAFLVDALVVGAVGSVPVVGGLAGTVYVLFRDGLDVDFMRHRSLGKVVMKLRVVRDGGGPMDLGTSFRRNWTLAFASLAVPLVFIPILGWILIPFVMLAGLVFFIVETVKALTASDGRRWGDELAGTRVVVADDHA